MAVTLGLNNSEGQEQGRFQYLKLESGETEILLLAPPATHAIQYNKVSQFAEVWEKFPEKCTFVDTDGIAKKLGEKAQYRVAIPVKLKGDDTVYVWETSRRNVAAMDVDAMEAPITETSNGYKSRWFKVKKSGSGMGTTYDITVLMKESEFNKDLFDFNSEDDINELIEMLGGTKTKEEIITYIEEKQQMSWADIVAKANEKDTEDDIDTEELDIFA